MEMKMYKFMYLKKNSIKNWVFYMIMKKYSCLTKEQNEDWNIKGVNLGGLFVLEPWITPSMFYQFLNVRDSEKIGMDMFSFCHALGPNEGKRQLNSAFNVGQTPIGLTGPKDQHSFLQLLIEGTRNKTVTFIKMSHFKDKLIIPSIKLKYLESLDIINGIKFSDLINTQADAIIESLKQSERIPLDEIIIDQQNAFSMGQLIYYFELLTSLVGDLLNINTYNQPGVELGKQILIKKLKLIK